MECVLQNPFDQQFHKDGTGTVVRDPFARTISAWYYPGETTLVMGPVSLFMAAAPAACC